MVLNATGRRSAYEAVNQRYDFADSDEENDDESKFENGYGGIREQDSLANDENCGPDLGAPVPHPNPPQVASNPRQWRRRRSARTRHSTTEPPWPCLRSASTTGGLADRPSTTETARVTTRISPMPDRSPISRRALGSRETATRRSSRRSLLLEAAWRASRLLLHRSCRLWAADARSLLGTTTIWDWVLVTVVAVSGKIAEEGRAGEHRFSRYDTLGE